MNETIKAVILTWSVSLTVAFWLFSIPHIINLWNDALAGNLPRSGWVDTSQGQVEIIADHRKWEFVLKNGRPVFRDYESE